MAKVDRRCGGRASTPTDTVSSKRQTSYSPSLPFLSFFLIKESLAADRSAQTRDAIVAVELPLELVVVGKFLICHRRSVSSRHTQNLLETASRKNSLLPISLNA